MGGVGGAAVDTWGYLLVEAYNRENVGFLPTVASEKLTNWK